jgi:nitric oxide reductase NorD protein
MIDLDWEERVFLGLKALHRRLFVSPEKKRVEGLQAELSERRQSLLLLAQMVAGQPVLLFETDGPGLCGRGRIFLPPSIAVGASEETNAELYVLKTILAAVALREEWPVGSRPEEYFQAVVAELPNFGERVHDVKRDLGEVEFWEWAGSPVAVGLDGESFEVVDSVSDSEESGQEITEIQGKGRADVEVVAEKEDDGTASEMPLHTFEKVETLEEYDGLDRKTEADTDLDEHEEALEKLEMTQLLRSADRPQSVYRSDVILDGVALEVGGGEPGEGMPYPEWNYRKGNYREDWSFVQTEHLKADDPGWLAGQLGEQASLIRMLKRQFARIASQAEMLKRQNFGSEYDIDAVIDAQVDLQSGRTPSERLYLHQQREFHDVATMILMDMSYSTDSYLDNVRVLDVIRETILCVGEVLDEHIDRFAIAGFSSKTRRSCRFSLLKSFDDSWRASRGRLGALEAQGYTRIGPALRHAHRMLDRQQAERKVVILITDGKPCDYDQYEGTYGIKDVKKAIEEGHRLGIETHALAVDKQARESFPKMFARSHYDIVSKPAELMETMCSLYSRLMVE